MAYKLNDLQFILGSGGSGRQANGTDYISGLLFYNSTRPTLMGADNVTAGNVKQIFSAADAAALGIDMLYTDETLPTAGGLTITAVGADGDTIAVKVTEWTGGSGKGLTTLGTYTKVAADTTVTLVAVGVCAAINAGTNTHGYSATNVAGAITITARHGTGIYLNSGTPISTVIVGTITRTLVQFSGAVASKNAILYYHIDRFFKMKPDASLYVGIFDVGGASTFADLQIMQTFALGSIVQSGIYDITQTFALASLTKIQTQCDAMRSANKMMSSVVYAADIKALATPLTTLAGAPYNLASLTAKNVSALIDNDGNGTGYDLFKQHGKSISSLGACLGAIAESAISEDIGNPIERFNTDDGAEFDTLMFGDGTMFTSVSTSLLDALNNNRYIFLSKIAYTFGSYYSDNHTAIAYTSDYAWINDNRIIDRVIKNTFVVMTPALKSRLKLKIDGTMTDQTIAHLIQLAGEAIKPLIASDDLAGDAANFDPAQWVMINTSQKPNVTGKLVVGIKLVENGIAHSIEIPIGFVNAL